jgi:hypothetical protein
MVGVEEFVQLVARPFLKLLFDAAPFVIRAARASHDAYARMPMGYAHIIVGAVLCFFGGFYPTFFAALQVSDYYLIYNMLMMCRRPRDMLHVRCMA